MGKAEEKYRYLLNKDKYDPEVNKAVGSKSLSEKDANTINKIQEMMRKEKEESSIAARGKKPGKTSPGWALDAKTKLELKKRRETRQLPAKFGGRTVVTSENRDEFIADKLGLKNKEIPENDENEENENTLHSIAPVPDKKYIKGTPEYEEHKKKSKPINGMPTNRKKK